MSAVPQDHRRWQAVLAVVWAACTWRFWFLCDDAYITFRYAKNLVLGRGLVFNAGEWPPVEGYSNFGWLLLSAALEALRLPVEGMAWVSAAAGLALLLRVHRLMVVRFGHDEGVAFAAALPLALSPIFSVWSTSGLETMAVALSVFLMVEGLVLSHLPRPIMAAVAACALVLVRTEGWAWVVVISVLSALVHARTRHQIPTRAILTAAIPPLVVVALHNAWRLGYYGTLVPNTALVKVGFTIEVLLRGLKYVLLLWATTLVPALALLAAPLTLRAHGLRGAVVAAIAVGFPTYAVLVGGDFMPFGRMVVPGLAFAALMLADALAKVPRPLLAPVGAVLAALSIAPAFDVHVVPESMRSTLHFRLSDQAFLSEWGKWDNMDGNTAGFMRRGQALALIAEPGDAVVSGAVGAMAYAAPDLWVWDQYGLVTKEVAYRPFGDGPLRESPGHDKKVEAEFFAKYRPRFLYARSVKGREAAAQMKDSMTRWQVDPLVADQYVPEFVEVDIGHHERTFLLMVRRLKVGEDPAALWARFEVERKALHDVLREQYPEESSDDGEDG